MTRGPTNSSASATGAAIRKVQRHPISVSAPPSTRPSEKPLAPTVVKMLSARLRAGPSGNVDEDDAAQHDQRAPEAGVPVGGRRRGRVRVVGQRPTPTRRVGLHAAAVYARSTIFQEWVASA